jgi:hypothetical protein
MKRSLITIVLYGVDVELVALVKWISPCKVCRLHPITYRRSQSLELCLLSESDRIRPFVILKSTIDSCVRPYIFVTAESFEI